MIKPDDMQLIMSIKHHEGFSETPYHCPAGALTIGYGFNLDAGMTDVEAELLLRHRISADLGWLAEHYDWFKNLNDERQRALVEMVYQLGRGGFKQFKRMHTALKFGDYVRAADEALDSKWAKQTPIRAMHVAEALRGE